MKSFKDELQYIILGDEPAWATNQLKKTQSFLRGYAETSVVSEKQQLFKSKEAAAIIAYATKENLFYEQPINQDDFLSEGAEQQVYRLDDVHVIKKNSRIFYECWLDYFNSLLVHNFFFPATAYSFIGFKMIDGDLFAVVKQEFIVASEPTDLDTVRKFLKFNGFENTRNNDYVHHAFGLIFEDLHDENVLSNNGILFFVDTVFYLTPNFYTLTS